MTEGLSKELEIARFNSSNTKGEEGFEKFLSLKSNISLVDHNRNIFFKDRKHDIELLIKEKLGLSLALIDIKSNCEDEECMLYFVLV